MKVLLVGSGGREHALAWKLRQSPKLTQLYAAPGNPGIGELARLVPLKAADVDGLVAFAEREAMDLVIVGPEAPLALGLADRLEERDIPCFGPKTKGALLESSKKFAKDFMARHGIPTAAYCAFTSEDEARRYVKSLPEGPLVVKADGLAQGKGVIVAESRREALDALKEVMSGRFGDAGRQVVVEERMTGEEVSLLTFSDGKTLLPMLPVQDHKRVGEGDTGPNTGGMGAYAPVPAFTPALVEEMESKILRPLCDALRREDLDYQGCLYIGLMLTPEGLKVVEFNARFGDPETQALMPLLKTDLLDLTCACARGSLVNLPGRVLEWRDEKAVCVVMASEGYPGDYPIGRIICLDAGMPFQNSWVFHAGTARNEQGELVTAGGRVLSVAARGATLDEALTRAYTRAENIRFEGCSFRRDIARSKSHVF
ncbi:MAG: phosphoribosylamine--glycine ligase [Synergistaceae bacterium]|jgi:phosphoribosylamine--glycine ligase|nr:phosphoribosylamine--glycine ligase [Synergistaceae bacterium]